MREVSRSTTGAVRNFLEQEIEQDGTGSKILQTTQAVLRKIAGYKKITPRTDRFQIVDNVMTPDSMMRMVHSRIKNSNHIDRFEQLTGSYGPIELGDTVGQLHFDSKYLSEGAKKSSLRTSLLKGLIGIQQRVSEFPKNNRPKYIFGTSYLAEKLKVFGFDIIDPGKVKLETGAARKLQKSKQEPIVREVQDSLATMFVTVAEHIPGVNKALSSAIKRERKILAEHDAYRKIGKKYSLKDIKVAIIETEKFLQIDFEKLLPEKR